MCKNLQILAGLFDGGGSYIGLKTKLNRIILIQRVRHHET